MLDTWYPEPRLGAPEGAPARHRRGSARSSSPASSAPTTAAWSAATRPAACEVIAVRTVIPDLSAPPVDTHDVWLRLHLLSHRLIRPHGANLTGIFGLLTNVAWTSAGPVEAAGFNAHRLRAAVGHVTVFGVDKFPRMVDYVIPSGVRIADGDRVRLGAHLAEGTTVMHEGFVNYNAGTLGPSMVEGRISAGVVVGADSDVGGGASIMGTLSGGGTEVDLDRQRLPARRQRGHRHLARRRLRRRGRLLRHRRLAGDPARRLGGEGARALRPRRPAVPPQQRQRRARGAPPRGHLGRPQRRAARELSTRVGLPASDTAADRPPVRGPRRACEVRGEGRSFD